ncbi:MAG: hypothetical protein IJK92_07020 [Bacteroidales bacterium]|nr:hypothetical protein [Bacteroidales bacterium]
MAQQQECRECARYYKGTSEMRCSFYAAKPQFDDKQCSHFSEKRPLYGINTQPQNDNESISEKSYRGPWYKHGRRKTFLEKHKGLEMIIVIISFIITIGIVVFLGMEVCRLLGKDNMVMLLLLLQTIIGLALPFVIAIIFYRMKELTKPFKSHFLSKILKKSSIIDCLFLCQLIVAMIEIIMTVHVSFFSNYIFSKWYIYTFSTESILLIIVSLIIIVELFILSNKLFKLRMSSLGKWLIACGVVNLLSLFITNTIIITIFYFAFIFFYFKAEEKKLKNALGKLEQDEIVSE